MLLLGVINYIHGWKFSVSRQKSVLVILIQTGININKKSIFNMPDNNNSWFQFSPCFIFVLNHQTKNRNQFLCDVFKCSTEWEKSKFCFHFASSYTVKRRSKCLSFSQSILFTHDLSNLLSICMKWREAAAVILKAICAISGTFSKF